MRNDQSSGVNPRWFAKDMNMAKAFLVCSIAFLGLLCSAEGKFEAFSASAVPHDPILTVIEIPMEKCMCYACFALCLLYFKLHPLYLSTMPWLFYPLNNKGCLDRPSCSVRILHIL